MASFPLRELGKYPMYAHAAMVDADRTAALTCGVCHRKRDVVPAIRTPLPNAYGTDHQEMSHAEANARRIPRPSKGTTDG